MSGNGFPIGRTQGTTRSLQKEIRWDRNLGPRRDCGAVRGATMRRIFARPTASGFCLASGSIPSGSVVPGKCSLDSFSFFLYRRSRSEVFLGATAALKPHEGVPVLVGKAYDFVLWLLPKVDTFPRGFTERSTSRL